MSDYAHTDRPSRMLIAHRTLESRAIYGVFYAVFLIGAGLKRLMPGQPRDAGHESMFAAARTAASVMVASSFTGL